jgi:hypothetical protein
MEVVRAEPQPGKLAIRASENSLQLGGEVAYSPRQPHLGNRGCETGISTQRGMAPERPRLRTVSHSKIDCVPYEGRRRAMPSSAARSPDRRYFRGLPSFFSFCCIEASLGRHGGYRHPGWHLGIHLAELIEPDDDDGPEVKLDELRKLLDAKDDRRVWTFLRREFPGCMKLVPRSRGRQFMNGIYASHTRGRVL